MRPVLSHATVFTGLLPAETGIRDNSGYDLAENAPTLASLLGRKGYATGAAVSACVLRKGPGLERGFASYDDDVGAERTGLALSSIQRDGTQTVAAAEKWLVENAGQSIFYFLHLYEPHSPYDPAEPYRSRYSPYDGEMRKLTKQWAVS